SKRDLCGHGFAGIFPTVWFSLASLARESEGLSGCRDGLPRSAWASAYVAEDVAFDRCLRAPAWKAGEGRATPQTEIAPRSALMRRDEQIPVEENRHLPPLLHCRYQWPDRLR